MSLALHYHMYQIVIVANNGQYGGSNAYWPMKDIYKRQIFHSYGQPQVLIAFFEIDSISDFINRHGLSKDNIQKEWKYPPAGLKNIYTCK